MPLIKNSTYKSPVFLNNGHIQSIFPSMFRKIEFNDYKRDRIKTPDNDFLDLDWSKVGSNKLVVISHGLEGSSNRAYVKGMVKAMNNNGLDALAWNFRSCSGESNQTLRFYHNGATDDLDIVIKHAISENVYDEVILIGFSMGANLTLLYLGQQSAKLAKEIKKSVVFSAPCDLTTSSIKLAKFSNKIYMKRFLIMLHKKIIDKKKLFPNQINDDGYEEIKSFKEFDDKYTAPLHGFNNAEDYWNRCSCKPVLKDIKIPTLIVNAANDPFLSKECFPFEEAEKSEYVTLEVPKSGGHVGFVRFNKNDLYWSEERALQFVNENKNS